MPVGIKGAERGDLDGDRGQSAQWQQPHVEIATDGDAHQRRRPEGRDRCLAGVEDDAAVVDGRRRVGDTQAVPLVIVVVGEVRRVHVVAGGGEVPRLRRHPRLSLGGFLDHGLGVRDLPRRRGEADDDEDGRRDDQGLERDAPLLPATGEPGPPHGLPRLVNFSTDPCAVWLTFRLMIEIRLAALPVTVIWIWFVAGLGAGDVTPDGPMVRMLPDVVAAKSFAAWMPSGTPSYGSATVPSAAATRTPCSAAANAACFAK